MIVIERLEKIKCFECGKKEAVWQVVAKEANLISKSCNPCLTRVVDYLQSGGAQETLDGFESE